MRVARASLLVEGFSRTRLLKLHVADDRMQRRAREGATGLPHPLAVGALGGPGPALIRSLGGKS